MSATTQPPQLLSQLIGHNLISGHQLGMPFPPDKRERVSQTTQAPWSGTGLVSATFPNGTVGEATGFVIGDRFVVTVAHAVHDKNWGGKAAQVTFQAARDATTSPFGTVDATAWQIPPQYPAQGRVYDYCLLTLAKPLASEVFSYELVVADDKDLQTGVFQIAGYPDDKVTDNSMWYDSGALLRPQGAHMLRYRISTSGGQSGAAVATYLDSRTTAVVGIHTGAASDRSSNEAVRVTHSVMDQIEAWKNN